MSLEQIKKQAKEHKGMKFSATTFRYSFNLAMTGSMKLLSQLVSDGVVVVCGKDSEGLNIYQVA